MLELLRRRALLQAAGASDPLMRQHYRELADSYSSSATELREHGAVIPPPLRAHDATSATDKLAPSNDL